MKQFLIILLSAAMGGLAVKFGCNGTIKKEPRLSIATIDTPALKTFTDVAGVHHGRVQVVSSDVLRQSPITKKYITYVNDTLAPALKIATDKINELTRINASLKGELVATNKIVEATPDNQIRTVLYWKSKYFEAVQKNDTLQYKYDAVLDIVNYQKKGSWFGKDVNYIDVSSPDTNFYITGLQHFKKEIFLPKKHFAVSLENSLLIAPKTSLYNTGLNLRYNPDGILSPSLSAGGVKFFGSSWQPYIKVDATINLRKF